MFKINKSVHVMILLTFAIIFIVIYMYYTINDVKKLGLEMKKNSQDIQNIVSTLNNLNKSIHELKVSSSQLNQIKQVVTSPVPDEDDEKEEDDEDKKTLIMNLKELSLLLDEIDDDE